MSEMRGGICFILHADLHVGITLEIVMLGFQALHRNLSHRHPSSLCVPQVYTEFVRRCRRIYLKQVKGHFFL